MVTADDRMSRMERDIGELRGDIGELRGDVNGLHRRVDDLHRLMMVMITVAGGGLLSGIVGVILQLVK